MQQGIPQTAPNSDVGVVKGATHLKFLTRKMPQKTVPLMGHVRTFLAQTLKAVGQKGQTY